MSSQEGKLQQGEASSQQLKRELGLFSAVMIVSGVMIGSGIFIVSADIARQMQSPGLLLLIWVFTALLTLFGALSYGKLAAAFPEAGGQYVFLRKAWGDLPAFLYGWALFFVIQTGFLAAVAVAFAKFLGVLLPVVSSQNTLLSLGILHISSQQMVAILVLVVLTLYNCLGVKQGALLQNIFTVLKVLALGGLICVGLLFSPHHVTAITAGFFQPSTPFKLPFLSAFAVATVGAIFSADAWNNVTFIGSEIKNPQKNLPRAMAWGVLLVLIIYLLANMAYLNLLPFGVLQHVPEDRVATAAISTLWGNTGAAIMASVILVSTFGCLNGMTLAGARVFYAMAKDRLFFKAFEYVHPRYATPVISLLWQGGFACLLTLTGSYSNLLDYIIFTTLFFYMLTVLGMLKLAKADPKAWGMASWHNYVIPVLYIAMLMYVAINLALFKQEYTLPGLGIVALGFPIYALWKKVHHKSLP
jgi:basic amino acid/polyamine antiporter, APA family